MVNSEEFNQRLQQILSYYDLNASSLAEQIGVQRSSISHLMSGRNKPSLEFVLKLLEHFPEVDLYWLLNGRGHFPKKKEVTPKEGLSPVPVSKSNTDLFSQTDSKESSPTEAVENNKVSIAEVSKEKANSPIDRIVVFYRNGTFEEYYK